SRHDRGRQSLGGPVPSDTGCGNDPEVDHARTLGGKSHGESSEQHRPRLPRVPPHEVRPRTEHPSRSAPKPQHEFSGQLNVGDPPNPVGTKTEAHRSDGIRPLAVRESVKRDKETNRERPRPSAERSEPARTENVERRRRRPLALTPRTARRLALG